MSRKCAYCGMINFSSALTCRRCKKAMGKSCPECNHSLPDEATFCTACGAIFDTDKVDVAGYKTKDLRSTGAEKGSETANEIKEAGDRKSAAFQPKVHRYTRCPECWSKISAESKFCTFCGAKFSAPLVPPIEEKSKQNRPIPPAPKSVIPPAPKPVTPAPPAPKPVAPPMPPLKPAAPAEPTPEASVDAKRQPPLPKRIIPTPISAAQSPVEQPRAETPAPSQVAKAVEGPSSIEPPVAVVEEKPAVSEPEPVPATVAPPEESAAASPPSEPASTPIEPSSENATKDIKVASEPVDFEVVATEPPFQPVMAPSFYPQSADELGIEMLRIEGGSYPNPLKPGIAVKVKSFAMAATPVTNAQYRHFLKATGYPPPIDWYEGNPLPGKDDCPVIGVSFRDAWVFCHWAGLRLPTDEEWLVAFCGKAGHRYPWGDQPPAPEYLEKTAHRKTPWPVGSFAETKAPFGHLDLIGNVRQWTLSPDPQAPHQENWPWTPGFIGLGGSSYLDAPWLAENGQVFVVTKPELTDFAIGFRCVADVADS